MISEAPNNVRAAFEEPYSIVENYIEFCENFRSAYIFQSKPAIKRGRRKGAHAETATSFPALFNILDTQDKQNRQPSVMGQCPQDDSSTGSKPRGSRPVRCAALRARDGVAESYKLMSQTKLRRPTNFNRNKGFQPLPTIPATPDFGSSSNGGMAAVPPQRLLHMASSDEDASEKSSQPPVVELDRPSRSCSRTTRSVQNPTENESYLDLEGTRRSKRVAASKKKRKYTDMEIQETTIAAPDVVATESLAVEPMGTEAARTRTKIIRKNKPETTIAAPDVVETESLAVEPMDAESARTRTRTIRKNKPETTTARPDEVATESLAVEPMDTEAARTRTKTIRKNKPETTIAAPDVVETELLAVEPMDVESARTRTRTIRKNKPETSTAAPNVVDIESLAVEPMDTEPARTRTKTICKNKCETSTAAPNVVDIESLAVEPMDTEPARTRTKTIRKNKCETDCRAQNMENMDSLAVEPTDENVTRSTAIENLGNTFTCSVATEAAAVGSQEVPAEMSKRSKRSSSSTRIATLPGNGTFHVSDPMDTLDMPEGMQCFTDRGIADLLVVQNAPRTRSKVRAAAESRSRSAETVRTPGQNKESCSGAQLNFIIGVMSGGKHATPLPLKNRIMTPKAKTTGSAARNKPARMIKDPPREADKAKMAEARRKEEEALKKKQELMMLKKQEIRNQRETKIKKVTESRAAVEKEKLLQLEKEKREREEKEKQAKAELMRQKEEALLKKKLLNQQKAQEAEERRQKEEQIRLARLREQEEEQRKAAEARQRQVEEAERLAALRKQQQKEEEQARLLEKAKENAKPAKATKDETFDPDDYGIADDEEEGKPRRPIPKWAERDVRNRRLIIQTSLDPEVVRKFFNVEPRSPSLRDIFGRDAMIRPRTSSAVWDTPPPPV